MSSNETATSFQSDYDIFSYIGLFCAIIIWITCCMGIFGNTISILIFLSPQFRRRSINILLCALSVADLLLMLLAGPVFTLGPFTGFFRLQQMDKIYTFSVLKLYPLTSMCHCCSVWLLTVATAKRCLAVCKPFWVAVHFTRCRALVIIIIIAVISVAYNMVRFWEFEIDPHLQVPIRALRNNSLYVFWYDSMGNLTLLFFLPLVIILFCIFKITTALAQSRKMSKSRQVASRNRRTTQMLLGLAICFVFCYAPQFILNITEVFMPELFTTILGYMVSDLNNMLALLNSAANFFFYLKYSTRYRLAARLMKTNCSFCCFICRPAESLTLVLRENLTSINSTSLLSPRPPSKLQRTATIEMKKLGRDMFQ